MGIFIGRDELIKSYDLAKRIEDKKGIEGEINVGDMLRKFLPDDTYVIAQPMIGKYQPDFLIVSPRFGFRIVEVKHHSLNSIQNIMSNGVVVTKFGKRNHLEQIRNHVDDLKNYLLSNHSSLGDSYKMIGYCVIHYGFARTEFIKKFKSTLETWSTEEKINYFRNNLFKDQLDSDIDFNLKNASRFSHTNLTSLSERRINEIVSSVKVGKYEIDIARTIEKIDEKHERELSSIQKDIKQLSSLKKDIGQLNSLHEDIKEIKAGLKAPTPSKRKNSTKPLLLTLLGVLVLVLGVFFLGDTLSSSKQTNISSIENSKGESLEIKATVVRFHFDEKSGTKFLTLSDGSDEIDAVIFKDRKVPYIREGNSYLFKGSVEVYKGKTELVVSSVIE